MKQLIKHLTNEGGGGINREVHLSQTPQNVKNAKLLTFVGWVEQLASDVMNEQIT